MERSVFPQTKFHPPAARDEHVTRAALLESFSRSGALAVVVSAPAGFGKSTLLSQLAVSDTRVAWLSVDADDTGNRLWLAILTALRDTLGPALDGAFAAAEAPDAEHARDVQVALLDALAAADEPVTLILDDLHLALEHAATCAALDWFIARLPRPHRLVIASRRDVPLPALTRLRSQGDVLDLRVGDLRFADVEAEHFLTVTFGLPLSGGEVNTLTARTDGWPAALYLAALRLRLGARVADVVEQLRAGAEELVGDLADEVLRSCTDHEQRLVLATAVLDRFNVDLCVRLLGRSQEEATRAAFAAVTRASLLVTPLDPTRTWYRCHHLLRDALRSRVRATDPQGTIDLHVRAGNWLESEGGEPELHEAMGHYLAAGEWDPAAELLACHSIRFVQSGSLGGRAREWLAQFPADVVHGDARLCFVSALLAALDGDRAMRDRWLDSGRRAGWDGPMPDGTASLDLATRSLEAMLCFDDVGAAVGAARRALAELPAVSPVRAAVQALTAWHLHLLGFADDAGARAEEAMAVQVHLPSPGLPLVAYLPRAVLALIALEHGNLTTAAELVASAEQARDQGPLRGSPHALPVTCASARLLTQTGRPEEAVERCRAALALAQGWRDSSLMVSAVLVELARACTAMGDPARAEDAAAEARRWLDGARDPGALPAALAEALGGSPRRRLTGDPEPLSAREIQVLEALRGDGSLRDIADELYISRNTIKTHTRALYAKLGVSSRPAAVRRAQDMGLIDPVGLTVGSGRRATGAER